MPYSNLRGFLTFFVYLIFAACIVPTHSYPTTLSNTTQILEKRIPIPQIPTAEQAAEHLKPLGPGKQVFFMREVKEAASHYARRIGGGLLADADNGEGWATFEGGPFETRARRVIHNEPTWEDKEVDDAIQAVSNGFALNAEGDVVVVLPYYMSNRFTFWYGEYETLKKNPKVDKILAFDMKNPSAEPQGEPRELWPEAQSKTEHAG